MAGDHTADPVGALRSGGGNVLVVGDVPETTHRSFARTLLGDVERKRRLLVLAGRSVTDVDDYLPPATPRDPEHFRVVEHDLTTRSAATDGGDADTGCLGDAVVVTVPGDDLPGLGVTISETTDAFDAIAGGLEAGELGVCFDSLGALVAEYGETEVFGFLHILTERLGRAGGVASFHLPTRGDDPTVGMFESVVDAVVELGTDGDRPRHRWDLGDGDGDGAGEWRPLDADR